MPSAADKKRKFEKILRAIKTIKIQGARNIAETGLKAYYLSPSQKSLKLILSSRPTEPMLEKVLNLYRKMPGYQIINHFSEAQNKINLFVFKTIKKGDKIFTHCHSSNVIQSLIFSKKHGKKFEVYNTETRPLFQGRKTSKELSNAGIKVTQFVDNALALALEKDGKKDSLYSTKIFLGADALLKTGIINKIGSKTIAELALIHKIPLYIIADSWKFTSKKVPIEQRSLNEIWDKAPKKIKIQNPAFEFVHKKYITKIISELGSLDYNLFLKKVA